MSPLLRRSIAALRRISPGEMAPLVVLALGAGALFLFVGLADEVLEGETRAFDTTVLQALRNPADPGDPLGPAWLEEVVRDVTALGSVTVLPLMTLAAAGYLVIDGKHRTALFVVVAVSGGALISNIAKLAFARPRPDLVAHLVEVQTYSFPSGHATSAAVTYLTLGALLARMQPRKRIKAYILGVALVLTLLIGMSRIYLGVHWPSDVPAGWALGAGWAMLAWAAGRWLQLHGDIERSGSEAGNAGPESR
jgi:undecaprenyl-diphosphatase